MNMSIIYLDGFRIGKSQVKESDNESDRIPSVGIRRNLSVGFDRPPLLISSFNKLVPGTNFRRRSKPSIGSVKFRH